MLELKNFEIKFLKNKHFIISIGGEKLHSLNFLNTPRPPPIIRLSEEV